MWELLLSSRWDKRRGMIKSGKAWGATSFKQKCPPESGEKIFPSSGIKIRRRKRTPKDNFFVCEKKNSLLFFCVCVCRERKREKRFSLFPSFFNPDPTSGWMLIFFFFLWVFLLMRKNLGKKKILQKKKIKFPSPFLEARKKKVENFFSTGEKKNVSDFCHPVAWNRSQEEKILHEKWRQEYEHAI